MEESDKNTVLKGFFKVVDIVKGYSFSKFHVERKQIRYFVLVDNNWLDLNYLAAGINVYLVAHFKADMQAFLVDAESQSVLENCLVLLPEIVVSSTRIDREIDCSRKGYYSRKYFGDRAKGGKEKIVGSMLHEFVDRTVKNKGVSPSKEDILSEQAFNIFINQLEEQEIESDFELGVKEMLENFNEFLKKEEIEIHQTESSFANFQYGITGIIDAIMVSNSENAVLELKTGSYMKSRMEEIQSYIYSLMLTSIFNKEAYKAVVYYSKLKRSRTIQLRPFQTVETIKQRNRIACMEYMLANKTAKLPQIADKMVCLSCPVKKFCHSVRANFEDFDPSEKERLDSYFLEDKTRYQYYLEKVDEKERNAIGSFAAYSSKVAKTEFSEGNTVIFIETREYFNRATRVRVNSKVMKSKEYVVVSFLVLGNQTRVELLGILEIEAELAVRVEWDDSASLSSLRGYIASFFYGKSIEDTQTSSEGESYLKSFLDHEFSGDTSFLSPQQKSALGRCFSNSKYSFLFGLPNTGKTLTLSILVRIYAELGLSVLIMSKDSSVLKGIANILRKSKTSFLIYSETQEWGDFSQNLFSTASGCSTAYYKDKFNCPIFLCKNEEVSPIRLGQKKFNLVVMDDFDDSSEIDLFRAFGVSSNKVVVSGYPISMINRNRNSLFFCLKMPSYTECLTEHFYKNTEILHILKYVYNMPYTGKNKDLSSPLVFIDYETTENSENRVNQRETEVILKLKEKIQDFVAIAAGEEQVDLMHSRGINAVKASQTTGKRWNKVVISLVECNWKRSGIDWNWISKAICCCDEELILVGHFNTVKSVRELTRLMRYYQERGRIVKENEISRLNL